MGRASEINVSGKSAVETTPTKHVDISHVLEELGIRKRKRTPRKNKKQKRIELANAARIDDTVLFFDLRELGVNDGVETKDKKVVAPDGEVE